MIYRKGSGSDVCFFCKVLGKGLYQLMMATVETASLASEVGALFTLRSLTFTRDLLFTIGIPKLIDCLLFVSCLLNKFRLQCSLR